VDVVDGNRYKMLALAVTKNAGIGLREAMSLSLVEAYLALGATISG
jgi:hypothetical protein